MTNLNARRISYQVSMLTFFLVLTGRIYAAEYFCTSGNVSCLIASINDANAGPGEHVISIEPGSYVLQTLDNGAAAGANGFPVITGSIQIQATAEGFPSVIERDPDAPRFRIFEVAATGKLAFIGVTVRGGSLVVGAGAILNRGVTSLDDSVVSDSVTGFDGAIHNLGTLRVIRSIIANNFGGHQGGGILNEPQGNVLVENSTIAGNASADGGGILNRGSLIVKNSAIIFNATDCCQPGGGILNMGFAEIIDTTIAKNRAGGAFFQGAGGGVWNGITGQISITGSTIRENEAGPQSRGGGIVNEGGIVRIQNTTAAGNLSNSAFAVGQDCFGTILSLGNNLVGDPSGCTIDLQASDRTGDPGLGSLVALGEGDQPGKAFYPVLRGSIVINAGNATACSASDQLGNPRVGPCDIGAVEFQDRIQIAVDVRPRREANKVNPQSDGNINVAVFSENGFDATAVDPNMIRFGATGTEATPIHSARRDLNRDGHRDLVLRFRIRDLGIECGATSLTLTGQILDEQPIIGSSPIATTGCKQLNSSKR
jgi:hypothetical protein